MAVWGERDYSLPFMNNHHLRQYILNDVTPTGKTLGTGSYGSVLEVKYGNLECAAKKMHDALLQQDNEGVESVAAKYHQECQLMASLRHPNITQFLGICFITGSRLPLLVMERLEMSLDDLLENMPHLQLPLKLSFLEGVCKGLDYLHTREPSVVHRDLTAKNVLLSSSLVAKISDMGNSRIVNMRPSQLATLSKLPGTQVYMPPEAISEDHRYGPSLDIFSFGHLALFTLSQVFPCNLLPHTYPDPFNAERLLGRSEVERRSVYMERLEAQLSQTCPTLVQMVRRCLDNSPGQRPSSGELIHEVSAVKLSVESMYGGDWFKHLDIGRVWMTKEMHRLRQRIKEIEIAQERVGAQLESMRLELQNKEEEMDQKVDELKVTLDDSAKREKALQEENSRLTEQIRKYLHSKPFKMEFPLNLTWTHGPDMPYGMKGYIQSVILHELIYVGGGYTGTGKGYVIMFYNIHSKNWHQLPPYEARDFTMAAINNQLVLVGGWDKRFVESNTLGVWEAGSRQWTHPYAPMHTARIGSSAVVYKQWLIVAGGMVHMKQVLTVEVLDIVGNQWSIAPHTPLPFSSMKSAIVGDLWYLMGGYVERRANKMYRVFLPDLVSQINSKGLAISDSIWKCSTLEHRLSTPVSIGGELLSVGGSRVSDLREISTIHRCQPNPESWTVVGQLPSPLHQCLCTLTPNEQVFICGGGGPSSMLYIGDFS